MIPETPLRLGLLSGMLLMLAADAVNWFLGSYPGGDTQAVLVGLQLVLCLAAGIAVYRRGRRVEAERAEAAGPRTEAAG